MLRALSVVIALSSVAYAEVIAAPPTAAEILDSNVIAAVKSGDVEGAAKSVTLPFVSTNVWFADTTCQKKFPGITKVTRAQWTEYAACLRALTLSHWSTGVWGFEPGAMLSVIYDGDKIRAFSNPSTPVYAPFVRSTEAWSRFSKGEFWWKPDAALQKKYPDRDHPVTAAANFCITAKGAVEKLEIADASDAAFGAQLKKAVAGWQFKPFERDGKSLRVCTRVEAKYPDIDGMGIK